ncbi:MAG TPA: mandelate racemase/muconate lactonizing enzyme family protein, partial [Bryobacteraceae bacterium]|nr:mandelate racemase/muconate lactonizing enzyme family protein [Bryobacteraceae bacterium]
ALVRITLDSGLTGWGEAQAPVAPEVACSIVTHILAPILEGNEFEGTIEEIQAIWWKMYSAMRVRGQTGGFMLDAIAGVDLALWDLAGKIAGRSVSDLLGAARKTVPAYLSGLPGRDPTRVREYADRGFTTVKIFHDTDEASLLRNTDAVSRLLPDDGSVAVDALWRLTDAGAPELAAELDKRGVRWLEAPLAPESARAHGRLAASIRVPVAIGESYRTLFELEPFFEAKAMRIVQPDLGRTGITEGLRIAGATWELGLEVVPHVSIALGPQIAAAIHFAASLANCPVLEFNPTVLETANRHLLDPIVMEGPAYKVPDGPGLGITTRSLF